MGLGSVLTPFCLVGLGTMLVTLLCLLLLLLLLLLLSLGTDFLRAGRMVCVSRLPGGAECRLVECRLLELEVVVSLSWFLGRRWFTPSPSANSTHKKLEEFRFGSSSAEEEGGESTQVSSPYASYEG